jgi:hypothetical protein
MRSTRSHRLAWLALLLVALVPRAALAQAVNHLYDKLQFGAQLSDVIVSSNIRVDAESGPEGTDFELADLGISKGRITWAASALWRPGRRHEIGLGFVDIGRSGEKVLTDTINIGDTSFAAGLRVNTKLSAPTLQLSYRFAFLAKENVKVGFELGLGALFFSLDANAVAGATAGGADTAIASFGASTSVIGPTASLGVFASFRAGDHWYFNVDAGGVGAKISNIGVGSWRGLAEAQYYFNNHWAALAGWSIIGDKITAESDTGGWLDFKGSLKFSFQTIRLGAIYALH